MSESDPARVPVKGPLAPHAGGFCAELARQAYAPSSAIDQLRLMAHLSRWLADAGLGAADLTPNRIEEFVERRRACFRRLVSSRALAPLLGYLRRLEVVPAEPVPVAVTETERLLEDYRGYLLAERGLAAGSARLRLRVARLFLAERREPLSQDLERLGADQVREFVLRQCVGRGVASARTLTGGLRSLLRFLYLHGWTPRPLASAVPAVAGWSMSGLPRAVDADTVARLLASCDRSRAAGCRDYAILVLLARLGLRGHEVAELALDDVDWRAGELTIRGKGGRRDRLPLAHDVGAALVAYLQRGRPACTSRRVFVSVRAPRAPLSASGVRSVVRDACRRAGQPRVGAAPVAPHGRNRPAAPRRRTGRDRPAAAPPRPADDGDLYQGRPGRAGDAGAPVAGEPGMSALRQAAEQYLALRRALGFKLTAQGYLLLDFLAYAERAGADTVTVELALEWAQLPAGKDPVWCALRLSVVRGFAHHQAVVDPRTEVPPADLLPRRRRRAIPFLYSPTDIENLMAAARGLPLALQAATYETLIGLLAVSGLRVGEAIRLDRHDVDWAAGVLHRPRRQVRQVARGCAAREHDRRAALYARLRDQLGPAPQAPQLLVSTVGTRLLAANVRRTFARLAAAAGLTPRAPRCRPRAHDLRHSFAVATLLDWYRAGVDVQARLPLLSTFMGHVDPRSTYWYLEAAPELLALAADRLEHSLGELP